MEVLTSQIRTLYAEANEAGRQSIQAQLRDLQTSLDTDWDLAIRIGSGNIQGSLIKIGQNLSLFTILSTTSGPLTLSNLSSTTKCAPKLLSHLLRALSAFGFITEVSSSLYTSNRLTNLFANEHISGAITHIYDCHFPVAHVFPTWLEERGYKDITSNKDLPFQRAMGTEMTPFEWMKAHPEHLASLGHTMAFQREGQWFESYAPVSEETKTFAETGEEEKVLLVDVGGGFGQQASAFRKNFAEVKGRVVVQDIQQTLAHVAKVEGVEFEAHDFFTEQPIKGAKYYYLRNILHDWTDEDSVNILRAITPAMGPESRIVIDEVVLPDEKLSWQAAYMDITMMTCLGGIERTKTEYESLLDAAGLKLLDMRKYGFSSVVLAVPK
ncbi:O-methyltransferase [Massarina eburnea CBS 473.64]|uniref:O-methyltransferase n=1 Tax=Massarina eburnea CBS 473.64 TaxID=1395130 RepID=A0A6A6SEG5_9PLEO|nr:O-methyltransferase [Massarina eburnea CBS 473.64]